MNTSDPFDWLSSANPIPGAAELAETRSDPAAQALLARIRDERVPGVPPRHRRRVRHLLIPVVVAAAVTTSAAAAWVLSRGADDPSQVACFRAADLDADIVGLAGAGDPIAMCEGVWEAGEFGPPPRPLALHACVLRSGIVGVFPVEDTDLCGRIGLSPADLSDDREADSIVAVQNHLAEGFLSECVPVEDAREIIAAELDAAGLDEWTVIEPGVRPPGRPCASIAIDVTTNSITLVPVPMPPGG